MRKYGATALASVLAFAIAGCTEETATEAEIEPQAGMETAEAPPPAEEAAATEEAAAEACNRRCVLDIAETYVAALAAGDPSAAPLAGDVAFVENLAPMAVGEGLWETAVSGPDDFGIYVPDPTNHTAGFLGIITAMAAPPAPQGMSAEERAEFAATAEKTEQPTLIAIRLKLDGREIVEAEHLVTGVRDMEPFAAPRQGLLSAVSRENRLTHKELIAIGESYYDALDDNDGTLMPFAPDCERHENGMTTASGEPRPDAPAVPGQAPTPQVARDCEGQLSSNVMAYITTIDNRRVFAADPRNGLVMGLSHFRHPMDFEPYEVTHMDGSTSTRSVEDMGFAPFDLPAAHIFKIGEDGLVHEIEAMGFMAPYDSPTGWE